MCHLWCCCCCCCCYCCCCWWWWSVRQTEQACDYPPIDTFLAYDYVSTYVYPSKETNMHHCFLALTETVPLCKFQLSLKLHNCASSNFNQSWETMRISDFHQSCAAVHVLTFTKAVQPCKLCHQSCTTKQVLSPKLCNCASSNFHQSCTTIQIVTFTKAV